MSSTNDTAKCEERKESQKSYPSFGDASRAVRHSRLFSPLRKQVHNLRDVLRVLRGRRPMGVDRSNLIDPLRKRVHFLRNVLHVVGQRRREWMGSIGGARKSVEVIDGIEVKNVSSAQRFAHKVRDRNRASRRQRRALRAAHSLSKLSDGDFILVIAELLFQGRGANPVDLDNYKRHLREDPDRRSELIDQLLGEHYIRLVHGENFGHDPHTVQIMGTHNFLTKAQWDERAKKIGLTNVSGKERHQIKLSERKFEHTGEYVVSAIASLYKGRQYLEAFLENITSQTIFDKSELIIIDANSPEGEGELIAQYQAVYPNIIYKRVNHRIGIYDAWNDAVEMARGRYLTNTNLDDLRRADSFELQAAALDEFKFADVVYQDFFYSLDSSYGVDDVAKFCYTSSLPVLTINNLLRFNSPHNAPMWRAQLHKEVGLFDVSFKSAGDYEFWLRCSLYGKRFYKLNSPHVVYFQNPEGISTGPQTKGIVEARRLMNMYARKLISPHLRKSRAEFAAELGIEPTWEWETPLYDVVQGELARLNDRLH